MYGLAGELGHHLQVRLPQVRAHEAQRRATGGAEPVDHAGSRPCARVQSTAVACSGGQSGRPGSGTGARVREYEGIRVMNESVSIFLYEDDQAYADEIKCRLEELAQARKISLSIDSYQFALHALNAIDRWDDRKRPPHAALLDMHQHDRSEAGLDICKEIRKKWPRVPVFFMSNSATSTGDHRRAYDARAINFFNKDAIEGPEGKEELFSAILSQIDIINAREDVAGLVQSGSLRIAMEPPSVHWRGKAISLNPKQRSVLYELARDEGKVCRNEKLAKIGGWIGDSKDNYYANLRQCIAEIREKIGDRAWRSEEGRRYGLIAVPKQGYQWIPDPQKSS